MARPATVAVATVAGSVLGGLGVTVLQALGLPAVAVMILTLGSCLLVGVVCGWLENNRPRATETCQRQCWLNRAARRQGRRST